MVAVRKYSEDASKGGRRQQPCESKQRVKKGAFLEVGKLRPPALPTEILIQMLLKPRVLLSGTASAPRVTRTRVFPGTAPTSTRKQTESMCSCRACADFAYRVLSK